MLRRAKSNRKRSHPQADSIAQGIAAYCQGNLADCRSAEQMLEESGAEALIPLGQALIQEGNSPVLASILKDVRHIVPFIARVLLATGMIELVGYLQALIARYFNPVDSGWGILLGSLCLYAALAGTLWLLFANEDWEEIGKTVRLFGRRSVRPLLLKTLNQIQSSDTECVTEAQGDLLVHLLKAVTLRSDEALAISILGVLAQKGDRQTMPMVEWAVHRTPKNRTDRLIQLAARKTLTTLQERAKAQEIADTYLRPASRPVETMTDELLRSAHGVLPTEEQELLRAVVTNTEMREC